MRSAEERPKKNTILLRLSSNLELSELLVKCKELGIAAFSPSLIVAQEQAHLAAELAKKTFASNTNIAKTLELEFLLWLSGERELRRMFAKNQLSPSDFMVFSFRKTDKKKILKELKAREIPLSLRKKATPLELESVSLSRI